MQEKKYFLSNGIEASEYQSEVFEFILHGVGNAFISAKAGSGKTTTLVEAMRLVPSKDKCLFIAFNKSIVEELGKRIEDRKNCSVSTVHSIGLSVLKKYFPNCEVDEYKYQTYIRKNISELSDWYNMLPNEQTKRQYVSNVIKLTDFSRMFLKQSAKEIEFLSVDRGIDTFSDEPETVEKILKWGQTNTEIIDYTDMVWLPCELGLKIKNKYDWVFCDEVQDFSIAQHALVSKLLKRGGRMVSAGDEKQLINGFAGASETALNNLIKAPNTQTFLLPVCYRCDTSIVNLAKEYVPEILASECAEEGSILYDCKINLLKDGDMVLCRTKAPLAELYVKLLKQGKKCYINGGDLVKDLIELSSSSNKEELSVELLSDGLFIDLFNRMLSLRDNMCSDGKITFEDATLSPSVMAMYESITTLRKLSYGLSTKAELLQRLENIETKDPFDFFSEKKTESDGICLSTIHKSKGAESDRVFILCRDSIPNKNCKLKWELEQEDNLLYVAITRAKHFLGFISDKEIKDSGFALPKDFIIKDIDKIEGLVYSALGKEMKSHEQIVQVAKIKAESTKPMEMPKLKIIQAKNNSFEKPERKNTLSLLDAYRKKKND